jgi:putative inorganic carbon (hco3(-)) transporter
MDTMTLHSSNVKEESIETDTSTNSMLWKLLYFLWVIVLFRPEWLLSYYIPVLKILRKAPTIIILIILACLIISDLRLVWNRRLGFFLIIAILSAFFAQNTGKSRIMLQTMTELYLLSILTFSIVTDRFKAEKLLYLYLSYFCYFGIWGFIFFMKTKRGIVVWDWVFNEEDSFGPLMCIGVGISIYFASARPNHFFKRFALLTALTCIVGVILSFARGAFIALIAILGYYILRSENRLKGILIASVLSIAMIISASIFFPDNAFWNEIKTSTEGTESGTGHDRKVLWSLAWEEFKSNPILGVGPYNFGVVSEQYLDRVKDKGHYRLGAMYGRALHNGFFQILCEMGIFGFCLFLAMLAEFYRLNISMRKYTYVGQGRFNPRYIALGFNIGMLACLLNAVFYDIIFFNWLWVLLILNRMYVIVLDKEKQYSA